MTRAFRPWVLLLPLALSQSACVSVEPAHSAAAQPTQSPAAARPASLAPYLETLAKMAPGDPARQQAELATTLAAAEQSPSAANNLRYALALGSAGRPDSNPVEAKRLITELLAGPYDMSPEERDLAAAYLREFDARVALYADLARLREESERKLQAIDATADRREDALAAENARLRKQLAEAERKLEAVAEMERSLLEQAQKTPAESAPPQR